MNVELITILNVQRFQCKVTEEPVYNDILHIFCTHHTLINGSEWQYYKKMVQPISEGCTSNLFEDFQQNVLKNENFHHE